MWRLSGRAPSAGDVYREGEGKGEGGCDYVARLIGPSRPEAATSVAGRLQSKEKQKESCRKGSRKR